MRPTETRARRGEPGGVSGSATAQPTTRTTEITVVGANCPWCFNDTLDSLRSEPGVVQATGSMAGQCLKIDHNNGIDVDRLMTVVRQHLHGVDRSSADQVMVEVELRVAEFHCSHGCLEQ